MPSLRISCKIPKLLPLFFVGASKRYDPNCFVLAHGSNHEDNLSIVIHAQMHLAHLAIFEKGITDSMRSLATNWKHDALKQIHCTYKRIAVFTPITVFLLSVIINLGTTKHETEFAIGNTKLARNIHGTMSAPIVRSIIAENRS